MENPRPEKVAVVDEVRERLASANASLVTEYRGLTVTQMAELRRNLAAVGDFKVYKNTLVRLAISGGDYEGLSDLLSGPTAIAFVSGEISAAAKTLRDFARSYPALVVKGGIVGGARLSDQDFVRLADLPSRDVLLARIAGGLAAPLQQLAGLIQALPRNLAYGLSALLEQRRTDEPGAPSAPADAHAEQAAPAEETTGEEPEPAEDQAPVVAAEDQASDAEAVADVEGSADREASAEAPASAEAGDEG